MYTRLSSIDASSGDQSKESTELRAESITRKVRNTIRRTFTVNVRKYIAVNAKSAFGTSQENLLSDQSLEKQEDLPGDESDDDGCALLQRRDDRALPRLPEDLIVRISEFLDEVSLLCMKNTNTRFRDIIKISRGQVPRCTRWMEVCRLEEDIQNRGDALPDQLACVYCKITHPQEDFGVRNGNVGYGIERLGMIKSCQPNSRYCWRHLPKRMNYSSGIENLDRRGRPCKKDKWVELSEPVCLHCGDRLDLDKYGQSECRTCDKKCEICGFGELRGWQRHGPQRPLETYANIRFVKMGSGLKIRDLNGIRDARQPLATEPRIWPENSSNFEVRQHWRACYRLDTRHSRRFSFLSPVERLKERQGAEERRGAKGIYVRGRFIPN